MKNLSFLLQHFGNFTPKQLEKVTGLFRPKTVKKNAVLLSAGEVCREFYFVNKGSIRTYFISRQGKEKTRYILLDSYIGTALTSFISQKPSFEFVDALEDSHLLVISRSDFYRLTEEVPAWKEFYLKMLEMACSFQSNRIESLVTLSAKQRYDQLLKENPAFTQRVSNRVLASYLDITQETLSRLKSR